MDPALGSRGFAFLSVRWFWFLGSSNGSAKAWWALSHLASKSHSDCTNEEK